MQPVIQFALGVELLPPEEGSIVVRPNQTASLQELLAEQFEVNEELECPGTRVEVRSIDKKSQSLVFVKHLTNPFRTIDVTKLLYYKIEIWVEGYF